MSSRSLRFLAAAFVAMLVSLGALPSTVNQVASAASPTFQCPGAAFQFPLVDGYIGWLYSDKRSIGKDRSYWHTGIDIWPKVEDDQALVYPLARGELHEVNLVPNSTEIYYPDQGVTLYMGHIVMNPGLGERDKVSPDKPIGKLVYRPDGPDKKGSTHLHLSMKYTKGWVRYNDQARFDETQQTQADDPSDAFNAKLRDPSGASNPWLSTYPPYGHPYQYFCRSPAQPPPVQAQAILADSIAAMRSQQKIEVRSKAGLMAIRGSGHVVLNLPDSVDGEGDAAGIAWSATSAQGRTELTVNGQTLGTVPSRGFATQVRDALLSIPTYGSDWTVRTEKGSYRLEGRVSTDGLDTILRGTGIEIPGNPKARLVLTIDPGAKLWQTLELVLLWPVVDYTFLGREIELGPAATTSLDFGNRPAPSATDGGQVLGASASYDERELAKSTAEGAVEGLKQVEVLKPLAETAGVVFAILDLRQAITMLGEEPNERAALQAARQRYGENSLQYDDALRRYREWEYRMPLVGPFLRFIIPRPVSSR